MALADLVHRTRNIVYGTGLGEKPPIIRAAADAVETVSGQLVSFNLLSGEVSKVKAGNVLSVYDPDTEADAHVLLVISIASDTLTCINEYQGSPAVADTDLDGAVFEQNAFITNFEIFEAIDTIFANQLWPYVYDITTATIASPDLIDGQEAIPAAALEIINAHQVWGPSVIPVQFTRFPQDVHTTLSSTGKLGKFDWIDSGTGYYTYKEKYAEADESTDELTRLVATGAAAILLGGHLVETTIQGTKEDNKQAVSQRNQVGSLLWRDFLTLRQNMSEELARRGDANRILIDRG